jgi:hypothetical protein
MGRVVFVYYSEIAVVASVASKKVGGWSSR